MKKKKKKKKLNEEEESCKVSVTQVLVFPSVT